ncbi:MAG: 16S rRNA (guanine(527)-N(7))-methyltransferase RsmG [Crocinitomicaceae bacterium]|nr:16S rRNA (guanine(527)-N(7))-methyltransferase RsmG [Crocinitomicaceae bacterium]
MDIIEKYFHELSCDQKLKLKELKSLYKDWNQKINVISRKDIDNFYERHVLHSLAIAKIVTFENESHIMDVGTGGGFPGLPLAILFPEANFTLLDSIGKKLKVIDEIASKLEIHNIETVHSRIEDISIKCDYIVSRAVTNLPKFIYLTKHLFKKNEKSKATIFYLKGGDFENELKQIHQKSKVIDLKDIYEEEFFETKKLIEIST